MAGNVDELHQAYLEGALRINERMTPADPYADVERTQAHVEKVLRSVDSAEDRSFARRVINTSSPTYERAFGKYITGGHRTQEEDRALSLTTTAGGYAVPYTLDPTVILTSAGRINPIRQLAQVRTITGNTWYGVSSTGISASYGAEATEASDNAPTLVQPSANVEKAQAFIPFSIEIGQDWGSIQSEMAMLFGEAKEDLESTQFLTGLGHGSNAPQGLIAVGGATAVVSTATTGVIAVADLYSLEIALQVRSRARGVFLANKAFYQKVRQFDTYGGANLWVQLGAGNPPQLLGYDAYEWSAYSSATTTSGSTVATFGDPSKFLIVDRVGMDVELIPHLFSTVAGRPTGQRGLYCFWRNTSTVLTPGLSANSAFQSLKVL
jgi:HK97 family phage major capsid protein